ncbi:50S ribosomal protein L20 [Candidatus Curtissbacteria bacterium]|nr:50S ribosomal protein L20 [Candidatus Curtissbacteria bacterium]
MRVKRGVTSHRRHRKILSLARGYRGGRSKLIKQVKEAVVHAGVDAYRGRKEKKRQIRALWITRINGALKPYNLSYSQFIKKLKDNKVELDRKILSQIALEDNQVFKKIVEKITS